mmetsp:Transcript_28487/g.45801  ORF Transcript_28487/g.45801 Transcript_28487/m.45801 type:complete len:193 (-) Transcript_28487:170-748(-)
MSYTVYYHSECKGFTGRAFSPLCILEAAGATYETKGVDAVPAGSITFAPPMCTFPDGSTISQTGAICIALGQALNLAPEGAVASAKGVQLTMDVADMFSEIMGKKGAERIMKWMNHFESALGDKPFMMGEKATYVDYTAMGMFQIFPGKAGKEDFKGIEMTPKIKAWYEKMCADPAVSKVIGMAAFLPDSFY